MKLFKQLVLRKPIAMLTSEEGGEHRLNKVLGFWSLLSLGVGGIIGAGIFVQVGGVARNISGPAMSVSFVLTGFVCMLCALCYAKFAAQIPVAGSAYTYAYASLGEGLAWFIGWDLILEYTVGAAAVASGWSAYFQNLIGMYGLEIPKALQRAPIDVTEQGTYQLTGTIVDLPALLIVLLLTGILLRGIKESTRTNAVMVAIKAMIVVLVIVVGAWYVSPDNWKPFAPYGWLGLNVFGHSIGQVHEAHPAGMVAGAAWVFFSYIGFDGVSVHSEESKNAARDVPRAIVWSLIVCTVLYIGVAIVLTGMVPYQDINVRAPIADAFARIGLTKAQFIIAVGAVAGLTSVLMLSLLSQARIFLAMARDGLIPKKFAEVHPRFQTPFWATLVLGCFVSLGGGILPEMMLVDFVNIGTLSAFLVVCLSVFIMQRWGAHRAQFYMWGGSTIPLLGAGCCLLLMCGLSSGAWIRLIGWHAVGAVVYLSWGRRKSRLRKIVEGANRSESLPKAA